MSRLLESQAANPAAAKPAKIAGRITFVQKTMLVVGWQGGGGGRQEIQKVDSLGLVLVYGGEGGKIDEQQGPSANAKGGENSCDGAGQQGDQPTHHPRSADQAP